MANLPPGSRGLPLVGETLSFLEDTFAFVRARAAQHGPLFTTNLLGKTTVVFVGAEASAPFADEDCCTREGSLLPHVRELFGGRSVNQLDGAEHRARKAQIMAAFEAEALPHYARSMVALVEATLARMAAAGEAPAIPSLKRLAIAAIAGDVASVPEGPALDELIRSFDRLGAGFTALPVALPFTALGKALRARDALLDTYRGIVREHRAHPKDDGLARILAREVGGRRITDEEAVLEVHHVLVAGYIVFAELAAMLIEIGKRPALAEALAAEIRAKAPDGALSARRLGELELLGRVVLETKRVTPVVPFAFGKARRTFTAGGYTIPEGTMLLWGTHAHNQDPASFRDPSEFAPERFAEGRAEHARHAHAFAPQGLGPPLGHRCAGVEYSTLLMLAFGAVLARDYTWSLPPQDLALTAKAIPPVPRSGLVVRLARRTTPTA